MCHVDGATDRLPRFTNPETVEEIEESFLHETMVGHIGFLDHDGGVCLDLWC